MFGCELEEGELVDSPDSNVVEDYTREDMDMDITDKSESILIVRNQGARLHLLGTQRQPLIKDVPVSCDFKSMHPKDGNVSFQGERRAAFESHPSRRRQPLLSRDSVVDNDAAKATSTSNSAGTTNEAASKRRISIQSKGRAVCQSLLPYMGYGFRLGQADAQQQECTVDKLESDDDLSLFLLRFQLLKSLNRKEKLSGEKESNSSARSIQAKSSQKHSRRSRKRETNAGGSLTEQPEKRHAFKRSDDTENRFSRSNMSRGNETCSRPNLLPTPESSASEVSSSREEKMMVRCLERSSGVAESQRGAASKEKERPSSELDLNSEEHELRQYLIASMLENRRQKALLNQRSSSVGVVDGTSADSATQHSKSKSAASESGNKVEPTCSREVKKSDVSQKCAEERSVLVASNKAPTVPSGGKPLQQNSVIPSAAKEAPRQQAPAKPVPSSAATGVPVQVTAKQTIAQSHPLASFVRRERLLPGNRRYVRPLNAQENSKGLHSQRAITFQRNAHNNLNNRNRYKWTQAKASTSLSNPVRPSLFQNKSYRKDAVYRDEGYAAFVKQKQKPVIVVLDDADSSDEECKSAQPEEQQPTSSSKDSIESAVIAQAEKDASEALLAAFDSRVDTAGKELLFYEKKIEEDKQQLYTLHRQQNEEELYYRKSLNLRAKLQKELEKLDEKIEQHKMTMEATNKKIRVLQEVIEKGSIQKRLTELKLKSVKCASTAYKIKGGIGEQPTVDNASVEGAQEHVQILLNACVPHSSLTAEEKLMVEIRESLSLPSMEPKTNKRAATFSATSTTPLMWFRSFRLLPAIMAARGIPLSSPALSNNIDPMVVFCPYALNGSCANDDCPWQHPSDCQLSQKEILFDLLSYHPEAVIDANGNDSEVRNRLGSDESILLFSSDNSTFLCSELYCKQLCQSFGQTETTDDLMKFCVTRMKNFLPSTGVCFEQRRFVCRPKRRSMKRWVGMAPFTDKSHAGSVSLCQMEDVSHILNRNAELRCRLWDCIAQTRRLRTLLIKQGYCPKLWREFTSALADIIPNKRVLRHICHEALRLAPAFDTQLSCFVGCANFDEAFETFQRCLLWVQQESAQGPISGRIPVAVANFLRTTIQLECVTDALRVLESEILCSSNVIPKLDEDSAVSIWLMLIHVRLTGCLPNSISICQWDTICSSDIVMPWTFLVKKHASLLFELLYLAGSRLGSHSDVDKQTEPLRRIYEPLLLLLAETSTKERLTFWIRESVRMLRHNKEFIAFLLFEPKFDVLKELTVRQEVVQGCLKIYPQDFRFNYYWLTLLAKGHQWGDIIDFVAPLNGYMDGMFSSNGGQPPLMTQLRSAIANFKAVADQLGTHWEAYLLLSMLLKRISVAQDVSLLAKAFDEDTVEMLLSPSQQLCFLRELVELMRIFKVGQHALPAIFRSVLLALNRTEQICLGSLPKMIVRALIDFVSEVMPNQKDSILKEMLFRFGEEQTISFRLIDSLDADSPLWCHLVQSSAHKLLTIERYLTCIQRACQKDNRLLVSDLLFSFIEYGACAFQLTSNRLQALFVLKHGLQAFPTCPELLCQLEAFRASSEESAF
ncbi:hypothetical protein M513_08092 [Trichuris suis]|uniref:Putative zinc-finger domain-containing protein n=1 Tax=Trichuris suis TaxID=68888 RepID=A0A085M1F5_9BILA|nr:hypothetical protein M513_08092 [Trichuris suis]